ncbi:FadR/GntR family transcriptional regulator [Pseudooceanicola aestuarii]|uniref:FadR/GntR family transcriptional regulator n=1 Tax=Pseudooceanicola aestuarii TaxID=2697319 RepID=UPI0013D669B6|nr:FCD domain-containing protein [Pseudooceanicola aestuarii]
MPFRPIEAEKRSDAAARQIELLILRGILRPGERLPAEREMAETMQISRPSVREAVAQLQDAGLLAARPGAGIFVAEVMGHGFSPALRHLFRRHPEAVFDYLDFRRDLEGQAAERAAAEGSETDLKVIATLLARMEEAHASARPEDEARLDAEFHMAIVEAGHNVILLHMMRSMFDLLREGVFYNRAVIFAREATRDSLLAQHRSINAAIQRRDAAAARQAAVAHLEYVRAALEADFAARSHEDIARLRLEQETQRSQPRG